MSNAHTTVFLDEVTEFLNIKPDGIYVDATLGMGGHALNILNKLSGSGKCLGIDQDMSSLTKAKKNLSGFGKQCEFAHANFHQLDSILKEHNITAIDGIVFDLGISSVQLDDPKRGFSFQHDGPLDMRMDQSAPRSAEDLVNTASEHDLAKIISEYGEDRFAKRIAQRIVSERVKAPISTTKDLSDIVLKAMPKARGWQKIHPATRTFQALRIAVNKELDVLNEVLDKATEALNDGGRICVIAFHSLEDRIVKQTFRRLSKDQRINILTKKPITPSDEEINTNSRSRSAKLRVAERIT